MKFSIEKASLVEGLSKVSKYTAKMNNVPILSGIYLEVSHEEVTLIGSNKDETLKFQINNIEKFNVEQPGKIVLPRTINEIVRKLPKDIIEFSLEKTNTLSVSSGNSNFTINGLDADEYPKVEVLDNNSFELSFQLDELLKAVEGTAYCASNDNTKPALKGINIKITNRNISFSATNSFLLSNYVYMLENTEDEEQHLYSAIVPAKWIYDALKNLSGTDVKLVFTENALSINTDNTFIRTQLIQGNYPQLEGILNNSKEVQTNFVLSRKDVINALEQVDILCANASEKKAPAIMNYKDERFSFINSNKDQGTVEVQLDIELQGNDPKEVCMGLNTTYLLNHLKSLNGESVQIGYIASLKPIFLNVGSNNECKLLLPVRL